MTIHLAQRIAAVTGVCPCWLQFGICADQLMKPHVVAKIDAGHTARFVSAQPLLPHGAPYTTNAYEDHRKRVEGTSGDMPATFEEASWELSYDFYRVLRAAARARKHAAVFSFLLTSVAECAARFGLNDIEDVERQATSIGKHLELNDEDALLAPLLLPPDLFFGLVDAAHKREAAKWGETAVAKLAAGTGWVQAYVLKQDPAAADFASTRITGPKRPTAMNKRPLSRSTSTTRRKLSRNPI